MPGVVEQESVTSAPRLSQEIPVNRPDSLLVFCPRLRYQLRMANESIDKLAKTLVETLPQGLRAVRDDLEKNFRSALHSGLGKFDLVTREEFEVQEAILARTRGILEALEARLAKLESGPAAKKIRKKEALKKTSNKGAKKKAAKKTGRKTARKKFGH